MITKTEFKTIKQETVDALKESFKTATTNQARPGEMIVFLAQGDHDHSVPKGYNSNSLDQKDDFYKELDRQHFLLNFMDHRYSVTNTTKTDDDPEMTIIELMTHTHLGIDSISENVKTVGVHE